MLWCHLITCSGCSSIVFTVSGDLCCLSHILVSCIFHLALFVFLIVILVGPSLEELALGDLGIRVKHRSSNFNLLFLHNISKCGTAFPAASHCCFSLLMKFDVAAKSSKFQLGV